MFQVFDNERPADESAFPKLIGYGWTTSKFETFEEALIYARKWLGPNWGGSYDGLEGIVLELNIPYDYDGFGDMILIKQINDLSS